MWRYISMGVLMLCAGVAGAQVFECTNARGVKEFAQFCPPGTVQQRQLGKSGEGAVEAGAAVTPAAPAAPKSTETQEAEFRKRLLERQEAETKAAQEKSQAEEAARNCLQARAQLQALQDGQRITQFDAATGERVQLGDAERAEEAARQRVTIERWCSK